MTERRIRTEVHALSYATFEGVILEGEYALTRTRTTTRQMWMLVKMKDKFGDARRDPAKTRPESVLSGRTIRDLAPRSA